MRSFSHFSNFPLGPRHDDPIEGNAVPEWGPALDEWDSWRAQSHRNPRGEDADKYMEAIDVAGGVGVRDRPGCPDAGGGPAERAVPPGTDPPGAGAV